MKVLPSGVYEYRFIVDGQWRHAPELPLARDDAGNTFNILDLQVPSFTCLSNSLLCRNQSGEMIQIIRV